jgi:hypothetical protein
MIRALAARAFPGSEICLPGDPLVKSKFSRKGMDDLLRR